MTETLDPRALVQLLLEVAPHMALIEEAVPYLPTLRQMAPMLDKWPQVEADIAWATTAPAHLQATAHQAVFARLAKDHGGTAALWGALALELKERKPAKAEKARAPRRGGSKPTERTEEDWKNIRARLVTAGQLVGQSGRDMQPLSEALAAQGVQVHFGTLASLKTGRLLKQVDAREWPAVSLRLLEDVIAGLTRLKEKRAV